MRRDAHGLHRATVAEGSVHALPAGHVFDPSWKNSGLAYVGVEIVDIVALSGKIAENGYIDLDLPTFAPDALLDDLDARIEELGDA